MRTLLLVCILLVLCLAKHKEQEYKQSKINEKGKDQSHRVCTRKDKDCMKVEDKQKEYKEKMERLDKQMSKAQQRCIFYGMQMGCTPTALNCQEDRGECICDDGALCQWNKLQPTNDNCPCDYQAVIKMGYDNYMNNLQ